MEATACPGNGRTISVEIYLDLWKRTILKGGKEAVTYLSDGVNLTTY